MEVELLKHSEINGCFGEIGVMTQKFAIVSADVYFVGGDAVCIFQLFGYTNLTHILRNSTELD